MRFRAFLVKNFYRSKYDYRQEWLRLTQKLGPLPAIFWPWLLAARAMAQIANSRQGDMWIARDVGYYEWMSSIGPRAPVQRTYRSIIPLFDSSPSAPG